MHFLIEPWHFLGNKEGIEAPLFSWLAAIILIILPAIALLKFIIDARRHSKLFKDTTKKLTTAKNKLGLDGMRGLPLSALDQIAILFMDMPSLSPVWLAYRRQLITISSKAGDDEFVASESAEVSFSEEAVVDTQINKKFVEAIPGIVTGTGLLFTFIAILIALMDLKFENNSVKGIDLLIQGLSGKFVSSVAALSSATVFLLCEKPIFYRLSYKRKQLVMAIDALIPRLTTNQVMANIQKDIAKQTDSFRLFNSDLSLILTKSFSDSVGPTLDRMVTEIENLNKYLRIAETDKGKVMVDQLGLLLQNLEQSIVSSLNKMGNDFKDSLSGNTKGQFDEIGKSLGSTAALLQDMNSQFISNQTTLKQLTELATVSITEQNLHAQARVEQMTDVLNKLMAGLSNKVIELSGQLSKTSGETTEAARGIIQDVSTVSSRNVEQLSRLLEKHETELTRVEGLEKALQETLLQFNVSIPKYGQVVTDLKQVANEVNTTIAVMAQAIESIKDGAGLAARQVVGLETANQKQKEVWEGIQGAMEQYGNTFAKVDGLAKELLAQINQEMLTFSTTTQNHFDKLGKTANEHIGDAVERLNGSIDELGGQLTELHSSIADTINKIQQLR